MKDILRNPAYAKQLLDLTGETLIVLESNGTIADIKMPSDVLWPMTEDEMRGHHISQIITAENVDEVLAEFHVVFTTGQTINRLFALTVQGKTLYLRSKLIRLTDDMILCVCRTVRAHDDEDDLRLAEERMALTHALVTTKTSTFSYLPTSNVMRIMGNITGDNYTEEHDISIDAYISMVVEEDRNMVIDALRRCTIGDIAEPLDYRVRLMDGKVINLHAKAYEYILPNEEGAELTIKGCVQNVTDLVRQRNDISQLTHAINCTSEDIYAAYTDGQLVFANNSFRLHNGISLSANISEMNILDVPTFRNAKHMWDKALNTLNKDSETCHFVEYDPIPNIPELLAIEGECRWTTDADGRRIVWTFARDISILEQARRELLKAKERAENNDKQKSAFLANMNHEIRTPLNAIVGFASIMAETNDVGERQELLKLVEQNNERLLLLINDILDMSRIEAGIVEFKMEEVSLSEMGHELYSALQFKCPAGVNLIFEADDTIDTIETDRLRLFQIVSNLVSNSFKYTQEGEVRCGFNALADDKILFYVSDTGVGIPADQLNNIFDRFNKAKNSVQGTGLGLSICKNIIELMGGRIWVESTEGVGSTFYFELPRKQIRTI